MTARAGQIAASIVIIATLMAGYLCINTGAGAALLSPNPSLSVAGQGLQEPARSHPACSPGWRVVYSPEAGIYDNYLKGVSSCIEQ